MHIGQIVLLAFGAFIILGGVLGARAGSKVSLIAGSISGALLFAAFILSYFHLAAGLWLGVAIGILLCGTSAMRLVKTRKFMPSGMLLAVSAVATLALIYLALAAV